MGTNTDDASIRPFEVDIDDETVLDLQRRLDDTRWPDQLPNTGREYGTEREYLRTLCSYWREEFDWAAFERRLNAFDAYRTTVDSQPIHFYHVRSPEPDALPLCLSHGWPGSVAELLDVLGPLSNPAAHGGDPNDAFHVVAPSLPGYGFSGPTLERGYDVERIAGAFDELMGRLGYDRYVAQGGDWGALVTALLGANRSERVEAIHTNMLFVSPSKLDDPMGMLDEAGEADYREAKAFREGKTGYQSIQSTKPQTLAYGLSDSPAGLAGMDRRDVSDVERLRQRRGGELQPRPPPRQRQCLLAHEHDQRLDATVLRDRRSRGNPRVGRRADRTRAVPGRNKQDAPRVGRGGVRPRLLVGAARRRPLRGDGSSRAVRRRPPGILPSVPVSQLRGDQQATVRR